ncbi:MAG: HAMP domain-containing histidine kinase, partial [Bdellovibrionaceae bacterium]|nr:HAMP domain-containing histidine kinase [Pseudobdellovibrionaceae bacterium]
ESSPHTTASPRVLSERKAEDDALKLERLAVDKALGSERSDKDAAFRSFVGLARESTDKNLTQERAQTDLDAFNVKGLLTAEKAAHSTTRSELTTREEFLSIVSHDLRNPIGTISSAAELLLGEYSTAQISDEARHWIKIIERNAATALRLIEDILDMERISEGKLSVKLAQHNLSDVIRESLENYFQISVAKLITLKSVPMTFSDKVLCDRDRITQVLSNLIGNAIKFTPSGGTITVKVENLNKELQVCVTDTGCGIAPDKKEHIFKRFAQIENKDRRGLGLGLYISKMLIESHNGKLWVESAANEGCSFYFTLPKAD